METEAGPKTPLATVLRVARLRSELTRKQVAEATGLREGDVYRWEVNVSPRATALLRLMALYRANPDELLRQIDALETAPRIVGEDVVFFPSEDPHLDLIGVPRSPSARWWLLRFHRGRKPPVVTPPEREWLERAQAAASEALGRKVVAALLYVSPDGEEGTLTSASGLDVADLGLGILDDTWRFLNVEQLLAALTPPPWLRAAADSDDEPTL